MLVILGVLAVLLSGGLCEECDQGYVEQVLNNVVKCVPDCKDLCMENTECVAPNHCQCMMGYRIDGYACVPIHVVTNPTQPVTNTIVPTRTTAQNGQEIPASDTEAEQITNIKNLHVRLLSIKSESKTVRTGQPSSTSRADSSTIETLSRMDIRHSVTESSANEIAQGDKGPPVNFSPNTNSATPGPRSWDNTVIAVGGLILATLLCLLIYSASVHNKRGIFHVKAMSDYHCENEGHKRYNELNCD